MKKELTKIMALLLLGCFLAGCCATCNKDKIKDDAEKAFKTMDQEQNY